jgi:signal transduction histidine kinase
MKEMLSDPTAMATAADGTHQGARILRARLVRALLFMSVLCTAIALLGTALNGGGFFGMLVYSFCIGMCCWAISDGVRLTSGALIDHARVRRGLQPQAHTVGVGWRAMLPLILVSTALGPPLGLALGDWLTGNRSPRIWSLDSPTSRFTLVVTLLATCVAALGFSLQERLAGVRAQAEAARRAETESQLRLLQSQLEPHMLFNTLANLRVLIGLDATRAQAMLDRLIAYLRATLQASRTSLHPLAAEFERLADYLALMEVRMGPRLVVRLELPVPLREVPVPPLILQALVENSIQHGLEPKVEGGTLRVVAERSGDRLRLSVLDDGVGLQAPGTPAASTGFGTEQVRNRLATLYGAAASLRLEPGPGGTGTRACIDMPIVLASSN